MVLLTLSDEEYILLSLLKRRLFTPFEVIVDKCYEGSIDKAWGLVSILQKRQMVEFICGRVIITTVGKKATHNEQVKRGLTISCYNHRVM